MRYILTPLTLMILSVIYLLSIVAQGVPGNSNGITGEEREGPPPCSDRQRLLPHLDCYRSDAHSNRARTSPTNDARHASSQSGHVLCGLAEEPYQDCNIRGLWSHQVSLAARKSSLDLSEQPAVPIWILERGK